VEVVDSFTVRFHFSEPYPYQLMDANDGPIVPRHRLASVPPESMATCAFGRHPVGNGPYRLARWEEGRFLELEANPGYYEKGKPRIPRVIFRIVPDLVALELQLETGEVDCLESVPPERAARWERSGGEIRIYRFPSRRVTFLAFNLEDPILSDRRVRRALQRALDPEAIVDAVWRGYARAVASPMHPLLWACDTTLVPPTQDLEAARTMLEEAGWRDLDGDGVRERGGRRLVLEILTNAGNPQRLDVATLAQAFFAEIGVEARVRPLEWGTFVDRLLEGRFQACVMGWKVGTRADLRPFWHSEAVGRGGFNICRLRDPEVDRLIEEARRERRVEVARRLWSVCQRRIAEEVPMALQVVPDELVALRRSFVPVDPNPISFFQRLREWRWRGAEPSRQ
jgi:peptide/nickel transport system substrate-binding protein